METLKEIAKELRAAGKHLEAANQLHYELPQGTWENIPCAAATLYNSRSDLADVVRAINAVLRKVKAA